MKTFVSTEVRCFTCGEWFRSPISFGDPESFTGTETRDNIMSCPNGHDTPCNKDNIRFQYRDDEGKVFYEEGKDTL